MKSVDEENSDRTRRSNIDHGGDCRDDAHGRRRRQGRPGRVRWLESRLGTPCLGRRLAALRLGRIQLWPAAECLV
jgi:hypothetical protein